MAILQLGGNLGDKPEAQARGTVNISLACTSDLPSLALRACVRSGKCLLRYHGYPATRGKPRRQARSASEGNSKYFPRLHFGPPLACASGLCQEREVFVQVSWLSCNSGETSETSPKRKRGEQ